MIFLELFFVFFLIGLFTIGGGYAMLPLISEEVVGRGWISFEAITNFIAIAESTPGPFAVNTATLVGFELGMQYGYLGALLGAFVGTLGVVLPSFIIIVIIAKLFKNFIEVQTVQNALTGIKAVVVGLIIAVVVNLLYTNIYAYTGQIDYYSIGIIIFIFSLSLLWKKLSPIILILISGALGVVFYYLVPLIF